jgi:N utilization substance protein B
MPALDRNVLRIGLYEIQNGGEETPPAVALDEAVQLAKRYGTDQSGKFVNGLLDRFMPGKQPPPMPPIVSEIPDEPSESDLAETAPEVSDDDKTDPVASDDTETAQKAADSAPLAE